MAYWRESVLEDALTLAPRLREEDKQEIKAASGLDPLPGLLFCLSESKPCLTMVGDEEEPFGMFGLTPDSDGISASVWMLASGDLLKYRTTFLREALRWVKEANTTHQVLYNYVDERNQLHIKWLDWMGFVFINRLPVGPEKLPFLEFVRIEPCAWQQQPSPRQ